MYTCLHTSGRTSEIDPIILYSYNPDTCGTEHKQYKHGQALTSWVPCAFYTHLKQIGHFLIWLKHVCAAEKGMIFQGLES